MDCCIQVSHTVHRSDTKVSDEPVLWLSPGPTRNRILFGLSSPSFGSLSKEYCLSPHDESMTTWQLKNKSGCSMGSTTSGVSRESDPMNHSHHISCPFSRNRKGYKFLLASIITRCVGCSRVPKARSPCLWISDS